MSLFSSNYSSSPQEVNIKVNKYLNNLVGFELWEILTMLTVVLSLASAIMWYSSFQPRQAMSELASMEKRKHIIYNNFLANQLSLKKDNPVYLPESDFANDISTLKLNTDYLDQQLSLIKSNLEQNNNLKEDLKSTSKIMTDQVNLTTLVSSYDSYLGELQNYRTSQYNFYKASFDTRVILLQIATKKFEKDDNIASKIDNIISNEADTSNSDNSSSIQPLLSQFEYFYNNNSDTRITSLKNISSQIFGLKFNPESETDKIIEKAADLLDSLKDLENKEKSIIKADTDLDSKVVFVSF